jgi:hypothetical protein
VSGYTGKRMTVRRRTRRGACPRCRLRYTWTGAPLLREARCRICKYPLEYLRTEFPWGRFRWGRRSSLRPHISRLRAIHWTHLHTKPWGSPEPKAIGPIVFVYATGRRVRWRSDTRERAVKFARRHHCTFKEMPLPAGLRRHLPPVPSASTTQMSSSGTTDAPVRAARTRGAR